MMPSNETGEKQEGGVWESLKDSSRAEIEQVRKELTEINLMVEQSQVEVNKLTQRNASITVRLQQVQGQFDSMPREDIRSAYDSALDAQQRLFVMRGQVDKLQSDRGQLERYLSFLEKVLATFEGGLPQDKRFRDLESTAETVEMIIQAQEAERQRLARQMHDGPAQALSNFILQTEIAMRLFELDQSKAKDELTHLKAAATTTFQKVRDFIFELRPMMLDDLGLAPTMNRYVEALRDQSGIDVRLVSMGMEQRLETYLEVMIFRAIQELLTNAIKHSQATQIKLQMDHAAGEFRVTLEDNGKGFEVDSLEEQTGMGLKVIRDRVEMLGGGLDIESVIGQGTTVSFHIPAAKTTTTFA